MKNGGKNKSVAFIILVNIYKYTMFMFMFPFTIHVVSGVSCNPSGEIKIET